jgi:OmpA family
LRLQTIRDSEGGLAGTHDLPDDSPVLVGPSTADQFNKIVPAIIPIACWRADDIRFKFGSSFVNPEITAELQPTDASMAGPDLTSLIKRHPGCPLSVFGHADPVGSDDYNKVLSGRRATAIYAMLIRDTNLWEHLYSSPLGDDKWGKEALMVMLDEVSPSDVPDGQSQIQQAEQNDAPLSQEDSDLSQNADSIAADAGKRKALFAAYMDKLCGPGLKLNKTDFLAQGADTGGKGEYQGCGDFNPLLIFSHKDNDEFEQATDKTKRNNANGPNRRVMVLLFRKGSRIIPSKWPCPRTNEGVAGCRKRFWSDGEKRRNTRLPHTARKFDETHNTFACRFYQRLTSSSPCEAIIPIDVGIRLFDHHDMPMPGALFLARFTGNKRRGTADGSGFILLKDVHPPTTIYLQWRPPSEDEPKADLIASGSDPALLGGAREPDEGLFFYRRSLFVNAPKRIGNGVRERLHNLGFSRRQEIPENVRAFQRNYALPETGREQDVLVRIIDVHDPGAVTAFVPLNTGPPVDNNP